MSRIALKTISASTLLMVLAAAPAEAHVGVGSSSSFASGLWHPFSGLDHMAAMVAVGLWAGLKGGKAISAWPAAFVGVMLIGSVLGITGIAVPFVEPGILASVVALGLLVALAIDLPVTAGIAIIGLFALFHGHAHGTEVPENAGGFEYVLGFAAATVLLHAAGIGVALAFGARFRGTLRAVGAACAAVGAGLVLGLI